MGQTAPKLFTISTGEKLVENKGFIFLIGRAASITFLDRTVAARRPEKPDASTTGIIPGDRGKAGDNWCRPPLLSAKADERHISPVPLAGVVSGQSTHEIGTEPQSAIRNRVERSQAHGAFRPVRRRSYPRGFWLLLRRPERSRGSRRDDPARRPSSPQELGAQRNHDGGERTDLAKSANLLTGAA